MDVGRLRTRLAPALALLACAGGCASVFGPTTAASFMRIVETDTDPNARYKAFGSLGNDQVYDDSNQKAKAAELLVSRLAPGSEPNASRAVICRTLGVLGEPVARDAMIRLCRDPDPLIRAEAYHALGRVGKAEDATILMQGMTLDLDDHCKAAAIEALGLLKQPDPRTEGYLVRALDHDDPRIRYASLQSLRKISRKDLGSKPEPWRAYVLAKYGEKIEAPKVQVADQNSFDPSAAPASMPAVASPGIARGGPGQGLLPRQATSALPTLAPGASWDPPPIGAGPGLPVVVPGTVPGTTPAPLPDSPQTDTSAGPRPAAPMTSPRGIMSRVFGY